MSLVDDVIEAHGGLGLWKDAAAIHLELSSGGLAFAVRGQADALQPVRATVATTGQRVELTAPTWAHRFDGAIPAPSGLRWSRSDMASFAATALWTYVSLPFILPELDVEERGNRLVLHFPAHLRTHSRRQVLHVDDDGLIRRHDYTAHDFGRFARASLQLSRYRTFDGIVMATRRRVHPRWWPHRPQLVWIDVESAGAIPNVTGID